MAQTKMSNRRVILLHRNGLTQILGLFDPVSMELRESIPPCIEGEPFPILLKMTPRAIFYKEIVSS